MSTTSPCPENDFKKASTPSREGVPLPGAKLKGKKAAAVRKLPDYISPPPSNAAERQAWDRMHKRMDMFHSHFRTEFQKMYVLADKVGEVVSIRDYLQVCEGFEQHINGHHGIEEHYIFPILGQRMPAFADDHIEEHKAIHEGLDKFGAYIKKVKSKPASFSAEDFRAILSSFGPILFYHLDAEVNNLKPEMLRRYYTLEEVKALPM